MKTNIGLAEQDRKDVVNILNTGLSDEYVVEFKTEDLGNGVFKISPVAALTKGEYGFFLVNSGNSNTSAGVGAKFFDFGVNMTP